MNKKITNVIKFGCPKSEAIFNNYSDLIKKRFTAERCNACIGIISNAVIPYYDNNEFTVIYNCQIEDFKLDSDLWSIYVSIIKGDSVYAKNVLDNGRVSFELSRLEV